MWEGRKTYRILIGNLSESGYLEERQNLTLK
jgi:hypothetical protein